VIGRNGGDETNPDDAAAAFDFNDPNAMLLPFLQNFQAKLENTCNGTSFLMFTKPFSS